MNGGNYCRPEWLGLNTYLLIYFIPSHLHLKNLTIKRSELINTTRLEF